MHEMIIANNIIREVKKHGEVKEVYLEIGELANVPKYELIECLKKIVKWKIHSKERAAKAKCECGFIGKPKILERGHDFFFIECPKCRKIPQLIEGKDIKIIKVKVK